MIWFVWLFCFVFFKQHVALMGTQCKRHFYSLILAGFSHTFLSGTEGVFHFEILVVAEKCKVPHVHPKRSCQLLCSTLTLPHREHRAVIHSQVMLQVAAGA